MLTFLFLNNAKENTDINDMEDVLMACIGTIAMILLDIVFLIFQPVFYLVYRFLSKENN